MLHEKLKPCPFCGGEAVVVVGYRGIHAYKMFKICCTFCNVRQVLQKTKKGAIEKWNNRTKKGNQ